MPIIPAICSNGHVFPSGFFIENVIHATFNNCKTECPYCGQMGVIPDGVYNIFGDSINFLKGPDVSIQTLKKLKKILEDARSDKTDSRAIQDIIKSETPELQSFADLFPKTRNELYAFISLLLALITVILTLNNKESNPNTIINIINENHITINKSNKTFVQKPTTTVMQKVGRNEPCPCKNGKKYKHCHGKAK